MIRSVHCDNSSFKSVEFTKGFNIVLADRTSESSGKDSRNGLGKTTLIEIINFCLGSSFNKDSPLRQRELENWTFSLNLTLRGEDFTVSRNTSNHLKIFVEGDFSTWPIKPERNLEGYYLKVSDWNAILGNIMFGLSPETIQREYSPTFRSLISFHIRSSKGAYLTPFKQYSQQLEWDIQVNNAYLMGLNWEYASRFQSLKDRKKTLNGLKKAAKQGLLSGYLGTLGELEAEKIGINEKIVTSKTNLASFKVHPQYLDIENEANSLTQRIHKLVNRNITHGQLLSAYNKSISEEEDVSSEKIENVYQEAGLFFPDKLKVKLNELVNFHDQILSNRTSYLEAEIKKIQREIEIQNEQVSSLTKKRAELLRILQKHGALEEYDELRTVLTKLEQRFGEINERINNLKTFEKGISEIKIKQQELFQQTRRDIGERKAIVEQAIKSFNNYSDFLYSEPGLLSIDITDVGYKFNVEIKRAGSHGIGNMKIFCYDLMVNYLETNKRNSPGFLIHDSTIFDGVDERQVAKALELAEKESREEGFQYICTINSDMVPFKDFSGNFDKTFNDSIRIIFTDATEDGGLLGIRF
jgi:uncharacterized protein YydD (DUF2326 family)